MDKHVANPCIGYCKLNDNNICAGCGRTVDERTDWIFLTPSQQRDIADKAAKRLIEIKSLDN